MTRQCVFPALLRGGVLVALLSLALQAQAVEILHWDRKPLPVDLPVGTERVIVLDRNVRVGLPREIADPDTLRVQSAGGAIYLKANRPFDTQRVRIQDVETNQVVLFDLSAKSSGASDEQIKVVIPDGPESRATAESEDNDRSTEGATAGTPVPVVLTRFAAQSLYAPTRTIDPVEGIGRVAMRLPASLPSLMPSLPVTATPVAAWKLDGWTVTAVRLINRDPSREFALDPRWLQGDLHSASFMHPTLGPRGSAEDTTTVFIVTNGVSLAQAVPLAQTRGGDS
ncbi:MULTISPECIES: TIGR03749 family integrating conjugative element protein [unclassified Modicisalibacter]|uniref:TIGR03749 family integrating conjugative element protein n=1 Tax=unclassified Modicisalibacter TaxID=2679913 RepID=UPI001CCEC64C|nr:MULTISPECIES: TIGR03749 family integrating conjugative element protein [unclassified Modicisalibacter]MBZ9559062.1 TIGR03749 family integrating conjugative element protein [Modicisalibacter sp. R2A 31.J]MBZ9576827.1 TIGR03749 family integrating conjugative element protein [Modicisalibacter sp. MOD 31.J]